MTIVRQQGKAVLVEWEQGGQLQRALLPSEAVTHDKVAEADLEAGLPQSVAWGKLFKLTVTPEAVERALKDAQVFTLADALSNPAETQAVLTRLIMADWYAMVSKEANRG